MSRTGIDADQNDLRHDWTARLLFNTDLLDYLDAKTGSHAPVNWWRETNALVPALLCSRVAAAVEKIDLTGLQRILGTNNHQPFFLNKRFENFGAVR